MVIKLKKKYIDHYNTYITYFYMNYLLPLELYLSSDSGTQLNLNLLLSVKTQCIAKML